MKRKLDDIGHNVVHKVLAAEVGRPGSNLIPQITFDNKFHSIEDILDADDELKTCIILGFSRDGNHLISYTPQACRASYGKDGYNLQLWTFTPHQPCRKLWSLPLFKQAGQNEDVYDLSWLTMGIEVYETTDSSLLIVHGRSQPDSNDVDQGHAEIEHHFAVCPGPSALAAMYLSSSFAANKNTENIGSGDGDGASSNQFLHISTLHFEALTSDLAPPAPRYEPTPFPVNELRPEVSIMEMPDLIPPCPIAPASSDGGNNGDSKCDGSSGVDGYTTVVIVINDGSGLTFLHVRLGLPSNEPDGWATYDEQINPKGTERQLRERFEAWKSLGWRNCWLLPQGASAIKTGMWKARENMKWLQSVAFQETLIKCSTHSATNTTTPSTTTRPKNTQTQQHRGLHIAVRMPTHKFEFDDVLCTFLHRHNLSTSNIVDYFTHKLVDTGHCVFTTNDNFGQKDKNAPETSSYTEIPCASPYLPNEPGLVFAVVVKFKRPEVREKADRYFEEICSDYSEMDALFAIRTVAIFAHISPKTGLCHIVEERTWPEFEDPKKIVTPTVRKKSESGRSASLLHDFQDDLAVPSTFDKSLLVLSNLEMVQEQGSMNAVYHPIRPQWLIGNGLSRYMPHILRTAVNRAVKSRSRPLRSELSDDSDSDSDNWYSK